MRYIVIILLFLLAGCMPYQKIMSSYTSPDFSITDLNNSKVRLFVNTNLDVLEFKRSFTKEYENENNFELIFTEQLISELNKHLDVTVVDTSYMREVFLNQSFSDEKVASVKKLFENAEEKYFLAITKVIISNKMQSYGSTYIPPTTVSTPGGTMSVGGGYTAGGQTEDCIVSMNVEIWSVKVKKRLSEFSAIGKDTVTLFMYGTTLKNAVKNSIKNLSGYIENNKIK